MIHYEEVRMDRIEADIYLEKTRTRGFVLGLENMENVSRELGRPDLQYKIIHVAGTNGKGSTCTMTQNILTENGYKTGLYTSPQLYHINDRIKIDGEEISDEDYLEIFTKVHDICESKNIPITEFEMITAIALEYFAQKGCDFVVLEVGMGGRLDATNIIDKPLLTVITSIALDHTDYLGSTLEEIAYEKGGIIKESADIILYPQSPEVENVIRNIAREKGVSIIQPIFSKILNKEIAEDHQKFDYKNQTIEIGLMGDYQINNGAMVYEILSYLDRKGFDIQWTKVLKGFKEARIIGRMQKIQEQPTILLDGAHNEQGITELKNSLVKIYPNRKFVFIIGFLRDKEYEKEVEILSSVAKAFVTVEPDYPERKLDSDELKLLVEKYSPKVFDKKEIKKALDFVNEKYKDDIIVICGSFYHVKDVLDYYNEEE